MPEHTPVRIGLIGAGSIARAHAIAYASARTYCGPEVPPVRLVQVADADEALAEAAATQLGFEAWTTDWEAVAGSPDVDLVSIATPNFLHAPMAIAAVAAGFRRVLMGPAQDDSALLPFPGMGVGFAESMIFQIRDLLVAVAGGPPMTPDFYDGWRALAVAEAVLAAADQGWVTVSPPPGRGA